MVAQCKTSNCITATSRTSPNSPVASGYRNTAGRRGWHCPMGPSSAGKGRRTAHDASPPMTERNSSAAPFPSLIPCASAPPSFRARLSAGFTVDPDHRRVALPLLQRLRRHHEDQGIGFSLGVVLSDPTSISCRFWTKYAETFPQNFRFLFPIGYWVKVLAPAKDGACRRQGLGADGQPRPRRAAQLDPASI